VTLVKDAILAVHQGRVCRDYGRVGLSQVPASLPSALCRRLGKRQWRHGESESPAAGSGISPPSTAQASLTTYKLDTLGVY